MPADITAMRQRLQEFDFERLFIDELGWNYPPRSTEYFDVDGITYQLDAIAEKHGWVAYLCQPDPDGRIPEGPTRRKIERQLRKVRHEHSIIYINRDNTACVWQWIKHEHGKPSASREDTFTKGQSGEALVQKLGAIRFELEEEDDLSILDVTRKFAQGFDVDKVTKKFYERFKKEHDGFLTFIEGIPGEDDRRWYASVMLNRLMFIYFIQRRGFLDNDTNYLRTRLDQVRKVKGNGKFHSFYRDFLIRLFHDGLGRAPPRDLEIDQLIGDIPYLNGGIFDPHVLERDNTGIEIGDDAFEAIFTFFDDFEWHLDDRPLSDDKQINPDVLGYIFEKYINQKQMGAYYTKEDITGYISRNTIIPYLFDAARKECAIAFRPDGNVWTLLSENPDEYIYDAVKRGTDLPLPEDIAAGLNDVTQRTGWNRPAGPEHALPTEIWREHVARRQRYEEVWEKLVSGEVQSIDDLITFNLNIEQFAQDVIENCEGPELLRAFYKAISTVSVLDPTCGSGAFLFAALNILEPLYSACLERMRAFIDDLERSPENTSPAKYSDFRRILQQVADHPNEKYFILKSIIVNNLYGVDIMEEAVEICKLRLFLKLASELDTGQNIEPLPDIDFNIRAGNTLVGFATLDDVTDALSRKRQGQTTLVDPDTEDLITSIKHQVEDLGSLLRLFREQQIDFGGTVTSSDKRALNVRLKELTGELDRYLARKYGIDELSYQSEILTKLYEEWLKTHQPFHWFAEFYAILESGGFDIVIGNPPYVEYKDIKAHHQVKGYDTLDCSDLYAFVLERALDLSYQGSYIGVIVPISMFGADGFTSLQRKFLANTDRAWISTYANRPSQLFEGAQKRLTIAVSRVSATKDHPILWTSSYMRWAKDERDSLFPARLQYLQRDYAFSIFASSLEKLGGDLEAQAFSKLAERPERLGASLDRYSKHRVYYTRKFGYFLAFLDFIPSILDTTTGQTVAPSELKHLSFPSSSTRNVAIACLSSSTFFWYWHVLSDCRNLNQRDLVAFPIQPNQMKEDTTHALDELGRRLIASLRSSSRVMKKGKLEIETFDYASGKSIIDEIDSVLCNHLGFSALEADFVKSYDIKYRVGIDRLASRP